MGKLDVLLRSPRPLEGPAVIEKQTGDDWLYILRHSATLRVSLFHSRHGTAELPSYRELSGGVRLFIRRFSDV